MDMREKLKGLFSGSPHQKYKSLEDIERKLGEPMLSYGSPDGNIADARDAAALHAAKAQHLARCIK